MSRDLLGAHETVTLGGEDLRVARLDAVAPGGLRELERLPYCLRVLLENMLRHAGDGIVAEEHVRAVVAWAATATERPEIPFMPSRVLLQDFTGVPCVVDLAALRSAVDRLGGDPEIINPRVPVDLVIDHSVQVDAFGSADAYARNVRLEIERNRERYALLKWAQAEFAGVEVVPTGTGIVHQINLEYLAAVVHARHFRGAAWAFPDTLVGTDSHTTMINGLGVLGWGVGGIEAEAVMLGQPYFMLLPDVVGVRLTGALPPGTTATDLVLTLTRLLRSVGVVGRFVEYFGPGLAGLSVADRATLANMAPEYGATCGFFPVDEQTLRYLAFSGRSAAHVARVGEYCRLQGLFRDAGSPDPEYTQVVELDLAEVEPSVAGPRRPQDLIPLGEVKESFQAALPAMATAGGRPDTTVCSAEVCLIGEHGESIGRFEGEGGRPGGEAPGPEAAASAEPGGDAGSVPTTEPGGDPSWAPAAAGTTAENTFALRDGAVVIAAITSCTNTSNPAVMLGAGLLARNAVRRGLSVPPWVKTSTAPGSRVVTNYYEESGLMPYLEALGFHIVGYGCTTCIGNSGPLPGPIAEAIKEAKLVTAAVLSGNRNFEARIHPLVRANYLASPLLVVAFALAGRIDIDFANEPVGHDRNGNPVYLGDLWPSEEEVQEVVARSVRPEMFRERYADVTTGDESWRGLRSRPGALYAWDPASTYVQEPPFFVDLPPEPAPLRDLQGARILGIFGDSVTTDHISPAGTIPEDSPAGRYLLAHGVAPADFNTYGSRRGNHEVMMRGTFANVRIRNLMLEGKEGGYTMHVPSGEILTIYEAAMRYRAEATPLVVVAGKEYGSGSSRDWAAKGPALLGVKVVIAESFERIHRSNLVGMGILPLQFEAGTNAASLRLTGREVLDVVGVADERRLRPGGRVEVRAWREAQAAAAGAEPDFTFPALVRLESSVDLEYYRHGGILQRVLRLMVEEAGLRARG
ncbi:MAG: aconitate hydratase [Thermoleophilia bacterium]